MEINQSTEQSLRKVKEMIADNTRLTAIPSFCLNFWNMSCVGASFGELRSLAVKQFV